jgi:ATP-dependent Clp protease ATP-binding subunit ClpA
MSAAPVLAPDAAIVLGIASTAMPFARTREEAAERWLRVLRLNGEAGAVLQALGVSEGPLQAPEENHNREHADAAGVDPHDAVSRVTEHAVEAARARGASAVATTDVLMAVMRVYGADFDRVLRAHGADRDELLERLGANALSPVDE